MKSILVSTVLIAACAAVVGCGRKLIHNVVPNQPPAIEMTGSRLTSMSEDISYRVQWTGIDADGRIDHYIVAIDPPSVDRVDEHWVTTRDRDRVITFPAARGAGAEGAVSEARTPHVVAVRAVDDRGAISEVKSLGFFAGNQPPTVQITHPVPNPFIVPTLPPCFHFAWEGHDPDGVFTPYPVKYKWTLLSPTSEFPIDVAITNPDSLRRFYAPGFAGWDSVSGDTTTAHLCNLVPGIEYMFVVVAFDEAGDYSPVFSLSTNMLRFRVGIAKNLGPRITFQGGTFYYAYPGGSYLDDPAAYVNVEVPEHQPMTVNWFGVTNFGPVTYRWALDPNDIYDDTPRSGPSDVGHWSPPDQTTTSLTLGPFDAGPKGVYHRLYVEARDAEGDVSLGILNLFVTHASSFEHELLIVDDTRLAPDNYLSTGCADRPRGAWPTAAELDTFLYARGGVPWRCYPAGTMSTPGLFDGYSYDTLGTRGMLSELPLSVLGHYRHVIWYTDAKSATYFKPLIDASQPQTLLRYMSTAGRMNTLATYSKEGGDVWIAGGGGAYASQIPSDDPLNNVPTTVFSSIIGRNNELGPGRFMYELPHWQSEIRVSREPAIPKRFRGRFEAPQAPEDTTSSSWIPYWRLPAQLNRKNTAPSDPLPPLRTTPGDFYRTTFDLEYLQIANYIIEVIGADPETEASTLDSLYDVDGGGLPPNGQNPNNVVMTYYHGPQGGRVVFSGFDFWSFRRDGCAQLVDFVLQELWHMSRESDLRIVRRAATRRPTP